MQNNIILNMQVNIQRLIWLISTPATKHQTGKICPMCYEKNVHVLLKLQLSELDLSC